MHAHVYYSRPGPNDLEGRDFDSAGRLSAAGEPETGPTIEFARSDLAVRWSDDYPSLLELAEACDVPVRWSCRTVSATTAKRP